MKEKKKSNKGKLLKYVCILALVSISTFASARSGVSSDWNDLVVYSVNDSTLTREKKSAPKPSVKDTTNTAEKLAVKVLKNRDKDNLKGTPHQETITTAVNPVFILDGKRVEEQDIRNLNSDTVESINVYGSEDALEKYGIETEDRLVVIETKNYKARLEEVVVILDGVQIDRETMNNIDPHKIESISIYKFDEMNDNKRAIAEKYNAWDSAGVVVIETKKEDETED